jgi:rhamnosyltransferase subunit B
MRRLQILLATLGSAGDVHPFIALGTALLSRGHDVTLITSAVFRSLIEAQGLKFLGIGSLETAREVIGDPGVWHLRKGFAILGRVVGPAIEELFSAIETHAGADTVVVYSTLALGARLAQEKLGITSASVHLQPSVIRSYADQGMFGNLRLSAAHPRWLKRLVFDAADALVLDRTLKPPLNAARARLGLAPVSHVLDRWLHSPQLVLALFPDWFAAPQPDWPPNTHAVGFVLWDRPAGEWTLDHSLSAPAASLAQAEEFLAAGAAPVVFTPGSAGASMQRFFAESVEAARRAGLRAMLVTNFPQQLPARLPPGIQAFGYLPFSWILSRAALLAYHGGIGTLAQALSAGVPQIIVPHGYDQFDSGFRIERLGVGASIPVRAYRAARVSRSLREVLDDQGAAQRRRAIAARIDSAASLTRACTLIEALKR